MAFGSIFFLFLFLPFVVLTNWVIQERYRPAFITLASIIFFAAFSFTGVVVLLAIAGINYIVARFIRHLQRSGFSRGGRVTLTLGLAADLGILAYFKWSGYIDPYINALLSRESGSPVAPFLFLAGMSFIVFSAISYLVDVWRGDAEPGSPFDIVHYLFFFPKLISGPIVRFKDFAWTQPESAQLVWGAQRVILGLGKKILIADNLGTVADSAFYITIHGADTATHWFGLVAYTLQIYFDFAGYSDMAIGVAQMLGYPIAENFNSPYLSQSITEFWRRWHISLGAWFRNYLYIPLGGNRTGNVYLNLFIVFLATGIWHGATMNFVLWGLVFAVAIIWERYVRLHPIPVRVPGIVRWAITFSIVMFNWVLFRASDLAAATSYYKNLFGISTNEVVMYGWQYSAPPKETAILVIGLVATFIVPRLTISQRWGKPSRTTIGFATQLALTVVLFGLCFIQIVSSEVTPFLYFQF
ncbi:MAG: MBOAT family O-acyltransferase [Actinomycetaceae bacterium]|nr:MBOAT family O-acyltransferase [Actinomycetaceae bacterium]